MDYGEQNVVVYENSEPTETCSHQWKHESGHLIEWNVLIFEEKVLVQDVCLTNGIPGDSKFLAISW